MSNDKLSIELVEYRCQDCGGHEWHLNIGHTSDGRTFLIISCADKECVEKKRIAVGADQDDIMIWDELDITGQGHDPEDMEKSSSGGKILN